MASTPERKALRAEEIRSLPYYAPYFPVIASNTLLTGVNEVVFLSNEVIRSPLALSNVEARIFALALGCLHQKQDSLEFTIHFQDITPSGRRGGSAYAELMEAQTKLTQPLMMTRGKSGRRQRDAISMFAILSLNEGSRQITGQFNPLLREHLLNLAGRFTTVELQSLLSFKSAHTQRLFWILRSYHNQTWEEPLPFETLREWLFGEDSEQYRNWTDFNRYVLKPAMAEFLEIGWQVEMRVQKQGRRVEALIFKMTSTLEPDMNSAVRPAKRTLTLTEIARYREELAAIYTELPALYDRLRLDFELKEYQAREVVSNVRDMTAYTLVTKVLYEVRIALVNPNNIKSVAAYTLSQIKSVLPVYQTLAEMVGSTESRSA
jgi:plasmid replication initiation protein